MNWLRRTSLPGAALLAILALGSARADELGDEPRIALDEYNKAAAVIHAKADAEIRVLQRKFIPRLKALQDKYCRAAKLDEALAVRETLRALLGVRTDPGLLKANPEDIGKTMLFVVTGSVEGSAWGTEVYTSDSQLAAAAVHAGVVKPNEKALVRVRIVPGQKKYVGSTAHGVTTQDYEAWLTSFTLERAKDLGDLDL